MAQHLFRQFVLKVHSRCNLACDHCYVYESVDQSWRDQPQVIADRTVRAAAMRIGEHAARNGIDRVGVVLHGGEPLLVGPAGLERIFGILRSTLDGVAELDLGLQTNGVQLDRRFAGLFRDAGVRVGISLDGGRQANDRHRRFAHGGSSYDPVVRAVRLLGSAEYRPVFGGLLCTVDVANDPIAVFTDLAALQPPRIDLLLPHATWEQPPPAARPGRTPYGDWLVTLFDHWYSRPPTVGIRLFEELMHALLGGASRSEAVGLSAPESIVIETDGSVEQTDALKVAFSGAAATGYNVFDHALDDVLAHPAVLGSALGVAGLSDTCRSCPILTACGGGLYPHRYRRDTGFANPSVYCADLTRLITHIQHRLSIDLAAVPEMVDLR